MTDVFVPFNDLNSRFQPHLSALAEAAREVIDSGWVVLGTRLTDFESEFAKYLGAEHCVGVATGTDAIELGLRAVGVEAGSKVGIVANAAMYSYVALQAIGAEPVFMDVDRRTRCATLEAAEAALDAGAEFIVITHLYGLLSPQTEAIAELCERRGATLFEDCAQAHGAKRGGRAAGTFGAASSFSFYPTKNLGAIGDGGAVVTNSGEVADRVRTLRQYGWSTKYTVSTPQGTNSRLDEMQAAFLLIFLKDLDRDTDRRREIANSYSSGITHPAVTIPDELDESHVAHLYVVEADKRDSLREHLKAHDVMCDVHYPVADHHQPILVDEYGGVSLPETERLCDTVLSLPCFPGLDDAQVGKVVDAVNSWPG